MDQIRSVSATRLTGMWFRQHSLSGSCDYVRNMLIEVHPFAPTQTVSMGSGSAAA